MNRKCKWCKKSVFPSKNRQFSPTNPIDVSDYSQYILAGSNLRDFSYWILLTKRRYDFSKIIWRFQLDTKGWRFFLISNLLLRQEHSNQIRKIAEITSYNFYILLKDTIKSLVINHKYLYSFFSFFIYI
jgi:hypothetical protein